MIIWRGRGILILLAGVAGGVAGDAAAKALGGSGLAHHWYLVCSIWGAAIAIWIFALTLGRSTERIVLDPKTHQQIRLRNVHSLYGLAGNVWGMLGILVAIFMTFMAVASPSSLSSDEDREAPAAETNSGFSNANHLISNFNGVEAFGNTAAARNLAQQFSEIVRQGREAGISASKPSTFSLSQGHFLTYCQLDDEKCAFIIHVPDLRHFNQDAKEWLGKLCWAAARDITSQTNPVPKKLAVGVRGSLLYDRVLTGQGPVTDSTPGGGQTGTYTGDSSKDALMAFFIPPAPKKPNPPAAVAQTQRPDMVRNAPVFPAGEPMPMPLPTPVREWKDASGRPMKASLEKFTTAACDIAQFKREDGNVFEVPVSKFSAEDQRFISDLVAKTKTPGS
jgi:hypothetical protein